MKRSEFLKTLSFGIAAAVITPKILIEPLPVAIDTEKPPYFDDLKDKYGHYEESWVHSSDPRDLFIHDLCVDKDRRLWMCTAKGFGTIELTALEAEPLPNFIDVDEKVFSEYFIIFSSAFSEGTGGPR